MDSAFDATGRESAEARIPQENNGEQRARSAGTQIAGIVESFWRLAHVQVALWQASLLRMAGRMMLAAALGVGSLVLVLVAVAFLYAGVFHLLTDYLRVPVAWALLIFAGVHGLAAGVLLLLGLRQLKRGPKEEETS
jgi:hypothetical protein